MVAVSNEVLPFSLMFLGIDPVGLDAGVPILAAEGTRLTCLNIRRVPPHVDNAYILLPQSALIIRSFALDSKERV